MRSLTMIAFGVDKLHGTNVSCCCAYTVHSIVKVTPQKYAVSYSTSSSHKSSLNISSNKRTTCHHCRQVTTKLNLNQATTKRTTTRTTTRLYEMAHTDLSTNIGLRAMEAEDRDNTGQCIVFERLPFRNQLISFYLRINRLVEHLLWWELGHNIAFIAVCRFMYL